MMGNKKINVLEKLKKDSFKKKENIYSQNSQSQNYFEITVIEKENFSPNDLIFNYDDIQDVEMRNDLIKCEKLLQKAQSKYHSQVGEILFHANQKYANNKNGIFGIWLNHVKIGKKNAERLINRFKFIKENCTSIEEIEYFESLPLSLTYEISSPNANKDLIKAVLEKKITTRKEYIIQKDLLKTNSIKEIENSDIININKLFSKLNSNISTLIENKIESDSIDSEKARIIYDKITKLKSEIESILKDVK